MSTSEISENLINVLFHGATEQCNFRSARSKKIFQKEALKQLQLHRWRLRVAESERDSAILKYKKAERPLKEVIKSLEKSGFKIASASLVRSRFLLTVQRGDASYSGILSFGVKGNVTINVFAKNHPSMMNWRSMIFSVQYRPKKDGGGEVLQRNTFIRGVMNSIGGEHNEITEEAH